MNQSSSGIQGILRRPPSTNVPNTGSGNRVSFDTSAASVQNRIQHLLNTATVPLYTLDEMEEKFSNQNSACAYQYASDPDDIFVNLCAVCEPYANSQIYSNNGVNCPNTSASNLAIAFYAIQACHRSLYSLYAGISEKLKHSMFKNVQVGCFRPHSYRSMPVTFVTVPFLLRDVTVGGVSFIRYACSNTIRESVWGVGFDQFLPTGVMENITRATLEVKKPPSNDAKDANNQPAAVDSKDPAQDGVSASAAPAAVANGEAKVDGKDATASVESLSKDTMKAAHQAVVLARMLTMSPSEMICFIIHGGIEKIKKLFDPEHTLFMGPLEEAAMLMNSFDLYAQQYAKVEGVLIPGQALSGANEHRRIIRVDQVFSLYNAIGLLYEHLQGYAVIGLTDETVVNSPYQLIAAIYDRSHLGAFSRDDSILRESAEKYAEMVRIVDDPSKSYLIDEKFQQEMMGIVQSINTAREEFGSRMNRAIGSSTMVEASYPEFFRKSSQRVLDELERKGAPLPAYHPSMEDLKEKPNFSMITPVVSIHQPISGMSGLFGFGRMNAFSRPGMSVRDLIGVNGGFAFTRQRFAEYVSEKRRKSGYNQGLVNSEQRAKLLQMIKDNAFVASMLAFLDYGGVPVNDLDHLRDFVKETVYLDPLAPPTPFNIINPELTLWENTALDIEAHMRYNENLPVSSPEIAKAFMFALQSNMHDDNDEWAAMALYGTPGCAKSLTLKLLRRYMFKKRSEIISSMTLAVARAPDSYTVIPRLTEEAAVLNLSQWSKAAKEVYALNGSQPPFSNNELVADIKGMFACRLTRQQRGQNMSTGRHLQDNYSASVTVNTLTTTNHDTILLDRAVAERVPKITYLGGAVEYETIAMRDEENEPDDDVKRAFQNRIHGAFRNVSVAYYLAKQCGLVKFFNSCPTQTLMAKIAARLQTTMAGISFYCVTEGKVMNLEEKTDKVYAETQKTARQINMRKLITFIAANHMSGTGAQHRSGKSALESYYEISTELKKVFSLYSAGMEPPVFCVGKTGNLASARTVNRIFQMARDAAFVDAVMQAFSFNSLGASYSTKNRWIEILSRLDETYQLRILTVQYFITLVMSEFDPVKDCLMDALGALVVRLIGEALRDRHVRLEPNKDGYYVFPDFFTSLVRVPGKRRMGSDGHVSRAGRPSKRNRLENNNHRVMNASSMHRSESKENSSHSAPSMSPDNAGGNSFDVSGVEEDVYEMKEMPLSQRVSFFESAVSNSCTDIYSGDVFAMRLAMSTYVGVKHKDANGNYRVCPFIDSTPFNNVADTCLRIHESVFNTRRTVEKLANDLICHNSRDVHVLTGGVSLSPTPNGPARFLDAMVVTRMTYNTENPRCKNTPWSRLPTLKSVYSTEWSREMKIVSDAAAAEAKSVAENNRSSARSSSSAAVLSAPSESKQVADLFKQCDKLLREPVDQKKEQDLSKEAEEGTRKQVLGPSNLGAVLVNDNAGDDLIEQMRGRLVSCDVDCKEMQDFDTVPRSISNLDDDEGKLFFSRFAFVLDEHKTAVPFLVQNIHRNNARTSREILELDIAEEKFRQQTAAVDAIQSQGRRLGVSGSGRPAIQVGPLALRRQSSAPLPATELKQDTLHAVPIPPNRTSSSSGAPSTFDSKTSDPNSRIRFNNAVFAHDGKSAFSDLQRSSSGPDFSDFDVLMGPEVGQPGFGRAGAVSSSARSSSAGRSMLVENKFIDPLDMKYTNIVRSIQNGEQAESVYKAVKRWNRFLDVLQYYRDKRDSDIFRRVTQQMSYPNLIGELINGLRNRYLAILLDSDEGTASQILVTFTRILDAGVLPIKVEEFRLMCMTEASTMGDASAADFVAVLRQVQSDTAAFEYLTQTYPASMLATVIENKADSNEVLALKPLSFKGVPYLSKLPPVIFKTPNLANKIAQRMQRPGERHVYNGCQINKDIVFSMDIEGMLEERIRELRYGEERAKHVPRPTRSGDHLMALANWIQRYMRWFSMLSSFQPCRVDAETGLLYFEQDAMSNETDITEAKMKHENRFLPVPLVYLKDGRRAVYASSVKNDLVTMFLFFFMYMRIKASMTNLIAPVVDYASVLYEAHSLGIIPTFQKGLEIVAQYVVHSEVRQEALQERVVMDLKRYVNTIIADTPQAAERMYKRRYVPDRDFMKAYERKVQDERREDRNRYAAAADIIAGVVTTILGDLPEGTRVAVSSSSSSGRRARSRQDMPPLEGLDTSMVIDPKDQYEEELIRVKNSEKLEKILNQLAVENIRLENCMYIPVPDDLLMNREEMEAAFHMSTSFELDRLDNTIVNGTHLRPVTFDYESVGSGSLKVYVAPGSQHLSVTDPGYLEYAANHRIRRDEEKKSANGGRGDGSRGRGRGRGRGGGGRGGEGGRGSGRGRGRGRGRGGLLSAEDRKIADGHSVGSASNGGEDDDDSNDSDYSDEKDGSGSSHTTGLIGDAVMLSRVLESSKRKKGSRKSKEGAGRKKKKPPTTNGHDPNQLTLEELLPGLAQAQADREMDGANSESSFQVRPVDGNAVMQVTDEGDNQAIAALAMLEATSTGDGGELEEVNGNEDDSKSVRSNYSSRSAGPGNWTKAARKFLGGVESGAVAIGHKRTLARVKDLIDRVDTEVTGAPGQDVSDTDVQLMARLTNVYSMCQQAQLRSNTSSQ